MTILIAISVVLFAVCYLLSFCCFSMCVQRVLCFKVFFVVRLCRFAVVVSCVLFDDVSPLLYVFLPFSV